MTLDRAGANSPPEERGRSRIAGFAMKDESTGRTGPARSRPTRRQPTPAQEPWERHALLWTAYLQLYSQHKPFTEALGRLYEEARECGAELLDACRTLDQLQAIARGEWGGPEWQVLGEYARLVHNSRAYLHLLDVTAGEFGLDRLDPHKVLKVTKHLLKDTEHRRDIYEPRPWMMSGCEVLHAWCRHRSRLHAKSGYLQPPDQFHLVVIPVDEVMPIPECSKPESAAWLDVTLHLPALEERRNPRLETRAATRLRVLANFERILDAELDRTDELILSAGLKFFDTDNHKRALQWLFWKARDQTMSYADIARKWAKDYRDDLTTGRKQTAHLPGSEGKLGHEVPGKTTELVRKAVERMANAIGVDRTGW